MECAIQIQLLAQRCRTLGCGSTLAQATIAVLEGLRQSLKLPAHLLRARRIWWRTLQTACLDNQLWDWQTGEVVVVKRIVSTTNMIGSALYEPQTNRTRLSLIGAQECVEIEL